ncbi:MAG TPA: hypothetical protein VEJ86_12560, partial [Candidatus Binataceae bacterium]|nr:hypothetical protein [Candidatus Binataceae bacterium]
MLRGRFHARLALLAIFTCGLTGTPIAFAGEIRVPLTIDYLTLSAALRTQLYTAPGGRAALWNGADQCQYLFAENPQFGSAGARVKVETIGTLSLGVAVAGRCLSPLSWNGIIETESAPYITPELQVRLRVQDINLYNPQHQKTLLAGKGFDLVKQYFIPRLETFTFDLRPAVEQLAMLAEEASPPEVAARVKTAVETIRAEPEVAPGET